MSVGSDDEDIYLGNEGSFSEMLDPMNGYATRLAKRVNKKELAKFHRR